MITLYNFGPHFGLPDPSPFCLKVDLYLRATELEYKTVSRFDNVRSAPKKKLPYISDEGKVIADSTLIIDYLKETYGDPLDKELNQEQKAIAHAFKRMLDENTYWCGVYFRWLDDSVWPEVKQAFFGNMPFPLKLIIPNTIRKGIRKSLYAQGLGRHSHDEILQITNRDFTALSDLLAAKEYFLINKLTTLDVSAYAFLTQFITPDFDSDAVRLARSFDNLVGFVERIKGRYYPDS